MQEDSGTIEDQCLAFVFPGRLQPAPGDDRASVPATRSGRNRTGLLDINTHNWQLLSGTHARGEGMELVFKDETLRIERLPGQGQRLVLALSGIGHGFGGMQRAEFVETASDGGRNQVLFVSDLLRSWYTTQGLVARISEIVATELALLGLSSCHTVGNSMGGYGAVRLSVDLPVATALSFSPQATMDRRFVNETRWEEYRPAIVMERHLPLWECIRPGCRYYTVFGADSRHEVAHRDLLPDRPELRALMLRGGGHNVVQLLKTSDCLKALVHAMLAQDEEAITAISEQFDAVLAAGLTAAGPGRTAPSASVK
jgi:pimeloyl-ACP methyl ester carboxylesterase